MEIKRKNREISAFQISETTVTSTEHSRKKAGSRDPGSRTFLAQIRKVEARLGKLAKIRKVETD